MTGMDVYRMLANTINAALGSPGNVSLERTVDQKCKIIISDIPVYPSGKGGYLVVYFPLDFVRVAENNDLICRELTQNEIRIFNGGKQDTRKALAHTNIFDDGHPCLGGGGSLVRIAGVYDFAAYIVESVLRVNMTEQAFLSPATRKYGATVAQMREFKVKVRRMLASSFRERVMNQVDHSQIYRYVREYFNDQYCANIG